MGRFEEGIAQALQAAALDPLTPERAGRIMFSYYFARQYDRALSAYRDALELDGHLDFPWVLGWTYREKGMYEEAIAELRKVDTEPLCGHPGGLTVRNARSSCALARPLRPEAWAAASGGRSSAAGVLEVRPARARFCAAVVRRVPQKRSGRLLLPRPQPLPFL
jgi:hypothetical protein